MGFFDYVGDLYAALSIQPTEAENQQFEGPVDTSGEQTSDKRAKNHDELGTAHHDREATTRGGVSTKTPASGTDEESGAEAEANKEDTEKSKQRASEASAGHTPGDDLGKAAAGQKGPEASGPYGGPVRAAAGSDDDDEGGDDEEEEEEEEEEEPEDPKPTLEEECMKTQQCAPLKHHYDECAERVTKQQEENDGKAEEDCVEEFFHLMHCATQCAAPKLFKQLR